MILWKHLRNGMTKPIRQHTDLISRKLPLSFFTRDVLDVAPDLIGKNLVKTEQDGSVQSYVISETEAYRGFEDQACHACKGMTRRTEVMFRQGGILYMYLIYGMYWMLNIVTEQEGIPQAVLIRGLTEINGPGRLTKRLHLDKSFNGEDLQISSRIWITDSVKPVKYTSHPRIGIDYAGEVWKNKRWRYVLV